MRSAHQDASAKAPTACCWSADELWAAPREPGRPYELDVLLPYLLTSHCLAWDEDGLDASRMLSALPQQNKCNGLGKPPSRAHLQVGLIRNTRSQAEACANGTGSKPTRNSPSYDKLDSTMSASSAGDPCQHAARDADNPAWPRRKGDICIL